MAGTEEGSASADVRIDSTKSVVIVATGFIKGRLNNYGTLEANLAERQQSRHRTPPIVVALTERGEHRAAEGACTSAGRYRQVNIVREYENAAISSTTDTSPVFQLMLSAVAKIQPHTVIIWKADSLGHDKYVLTMAKKIIRRRAAKYTCCGEHPDELSQEHAH
ncbi:MAG: hypothetical protein M3Z49_04400 [Bifidobacteriales bacterium]|uniref:Recombinase family protein n=1 Tax=Bifidobacterium choladohabitans TaxID=2750947 RepID=A0ABS0R1Q7_9BIFI|nr:recombinase family protein [Bifidobacterium choladohabitans]MBI0144633.1 recombinase family protein [Bifidobacterium choladohabitans]MCT6918435.1 hypothetical protein [Bifidobacteriales bacterium]